MPGLRLTLGLALAALLGAGLMYWGLWQSAPAPESSPAATAEPERPAGLAPAATLKAAAPGREPAAPATSTPEGGGPVTPAYRGQLHVHGRVIAPSGVSFAGSRLHVAASVGEARPTILERTDIAADGTFDVRTASPEAVSLVRAVASIPGFVTVSAGAPPSPDGDVRLDISLDEALADEGAAEPIGRRAWTARGRVLDSAGKPVVGLPVIVASALYDDYDGDHISEPWAMSYVERTSGLRGTAITDGEGRFAVRAIHCGGCARAGSGSPDWFVLNDEANRSFDWTRGKALTAVPAARTALRVLEAASDRPVPAFDVRAVGAHGVHWSMEGKDGDLRVFWPRFSALTETWIDLAVHAPGFRPETVRLSGAALALLEPATIRLRPLSARDAGRVVLVAGEPGVEALYGGVSLSLREPGRHVYATPLALQREAAGRYAATVGEGQWEYEVRPRPGRYSGLVVKGTIAVTAGQDAEIAWPSRILGSLEVRGWIRDPDRTVMVLTPRDGGEPIRVSVYRSGRNLDLPVGTWTISLEDERGNPRGGEDVKVEEGKEAVVFSKDKLD